MPQLSVNDPQRPRYHFLPPMNWMGGPCAAAYRGGAYHLFYLYYPQGSGWGLMHWGHAMSRDLVHWTHLPAALEPGPGSYDAGGVFSGCIVDNDGEATALYTGEPGEVQCLATATEDLTVWSKHVRNPVLSERPEGLDLSGFRDPCVWREGGASARPAGNIANRDKGVWFMALGSGISDVGGAVLLYRSENLIDWRYLHPLYVGEAQRTGEVWESPSFFPLGGRHVLMVSTRSGALYFTGQYTGHAFAPVIQGSVDSGGYFHGAQSFAGDDGRRLVWGWLSEGRFVAERNAPGWAGVLSLPRVIALDPAGRLRMAPAPELETLREHHYLFENLPLPPDAPHLFDSVHGDSLELRVVVQLGDAEECGVIVRRSPDGEEETRIVYNHVTGDLSVHREKSSLDETTQRDIRGTPFRAAASGEIAFHVFIDASVLEVFVDGTTCLSSRIYPTRPDSLGVGLFARGGTALATRVDGWRLASLEQPCRGAAPIA